MTACKSCKKSILFAKAERSGKVMPFERDAAGVWAVERWTSHFATCPHADSWRGRGKR